MPAAELDEDEQGQPGTHDQEQQPKAKMDRMVAARLQAVPQLLVGEPGGLGRGELQSGEDGGAHGQHRQWLASASKLAASGWLVSSAPMIVAGVGS